MDYIQDVFSLPGFLGTNSNDQTSKVHESDATGLLTPLRRLLRNARNRQSIADIESPLPIPATPLNEPERNTEETGYRIQILRVRLDQAMKYKHWLAAATELDALEGNDMWKLEEECAEYDFGLVRAKLQESDEVRLSRDQKKMLMLVRTALTRDLGGMGSLRLYKHCRVGTKALIERYIQSILDTIDTLVQVTKSGHGTLPSAVILQELLLTRQAFGRSALLLSGGGTFGMNHIGVIKSLFEANLLPRIISGASAGSIVSSVLCTKMDDEIPAVLKQFCYGDLAVFEKEGQATSVFSKAYRFMTKGSLFDIANLVAVMKDLLGDITFQEAYNRTRRILNICVSAASVYELPRLLNYITSPNVLIWSAVAASCSVPFIFDPGQLLAKDPRTGEQVPWNQSPQRWIDGSVENDIPTTRLAEMFNVNHFIVSQVNPHVVPFLEKDEQDLAKEAQQSSVNQKTCHTWGHTLSTIARDEAMHRLQVLQEFGVLPNFISKIRSVVGQRYAGDITIFPKISYANFPYVLSNPDTAFMLAAEISGERATWPKLSEIRNHCAIELAIDDAVHQMMSCVAFGPPQLQIRNAHHSSLSAPRSSFRKRQRSLRRASKTEIDLSELARGRSFQPQRTGNTKKTTFILGDIEKSPPSKGLSALDLHDFSASDADSDDESTINWDFSDGLASGDSSRNTPINHSLPTFWPTTRQLFPWASQPATPSASFKPFALTPAHKSDPAVSVSAPLSARPSSPELRYKRLYHQKPITNTASSERETRHGLKRRSSSALDFDPSGTRGMMRRRKISLSGTPKAIDTEMYGSDDDNNMSL